jgi:hypothetical protein
MECIGPIVVLVAVVLQVITAVRKNQEQARRRAMHPAPPPPESRPVFETPRPREIVIERDDEQVYVPPPPKPRLQELVKRIAAPTTVPIGDLTRHRRGIRLDRSRARAGIVLAEILGPPVALR